MSGMLHHPVVAISRFMAFVVMVAGCQLLGIGDAQADYCADTFGTVLVNPDDPQGDCRVLEAITLNYSGTYTDIVLMQHVDRGRDSHEAPERFVEVVSALRDTAARAGSVLTSDLPALRLPRVIHVILVPQEHSGGGRMRTLPQTYLSAGRIRDCPLVVYGYGEGLSPGRLRRTFAHELFHCA